MTSHKYQENNPLILYDQKTNKAAINGYVTILRVPGCVADVPKIMTHSISFIGAHVQIIFKLYRTNTC